MSALRQGLHPGYAYSLIREVIVAADATRQSILSSATSIIAVAPRVNEKVGQSLALVVEQLKRSALLDSRVLGVTKRMCDVYTRVLVRRQLDKRNKLMRTYKRLTTL